MMTAGIQDFRGEGPPGDIGTFQGTASIIVYQFTFSGVTYIVAQRMGVQGWTLVSQGIVAATVIQAAFNSLTPGRNEKEKIVIKGEYTISITLNISSFTSLELNGILQAAAGLTGNPILQSIGAAFGDGNGNYNIDIIGGRLDCNNVANVDAIYLKWTWRTKIFGVDIRNCRDAINIEQSEQERISYCKIGGGTRYGIYFNGTGGSTTIFSNEIHNLVEGIYLFNDIGDIEIIANKGYNNTRDLFCFSVRETIINNNHFWSTTNSSITLFNSPRTTVTSNNIRDCGADFALIVLDTTTDSIVKDNILYDSRVPKICYAINEVAGCDRNNLSFNRLDTKLPTIFTITGASTKVTGNIGFVTENRVSATITALNTSIAFAHGCSYIPAAGDIHPTLTNLPTTPIGDIYVDTIGAANATLHCSAPPGVATAIFDISIIRTP